MAVLSTTASSHEVTVTRNDPRDAPTAQVIYQTIVRPSTTYVATVTLGSPSQSTDTTGYVGPTPSSSGVSQEALGGIIGGVVGAVIVLLVVWDYLKRLLSKRFQQWVGLWQRDGRALGWRAAWTTTTTGAGRASTWMAGSAARYGSTSRGLPDGNADG
ncbi:uncharacterized protein JN550_006884 [Neoarthrinium moseri]|uniref:uncharacterized protein n=1 Tax=Neoarthrinium moseri TaxID=1658444 RepID=UPI001FDCBC79|nr:uncharacterized protein JN550_006884 [Neoarthrinium moseri]KAI1867743.1 hypothetical protein JN550_006884 [Neoarthrinium moseri]